MSKDFTSRQQHLEEDFYGQYTINKFNIHGRQSALKNQSFYSTSLLCNENTMIWKTSELSQEFSLNMQTDQKIHLTPTRRSSTRTTQKNDGIEITPKRKFKRHPDDFQNIQKKSVARIAQQQSLRNHNLIQKLQESQNINQLQSGLVIRNLQKRSIFSNPILSETTSTQLSPIRSVSSSHKFNNVPVKTPTKLMNSFLVKNSNKQQQSSFSSSPVSLRSISQLQNSLKNQCTPKKAQSSSKINELSFYKGDLSNQKERRQLLFGSAKESSNNSSYESLHKSNNRKIRMSSCPLEISQIEQHNSTTTPRMQTTTRSINSCFSEGNTNFEIKKNQIKKKRQSDFSTFDNSHQTVQINQFVFRHPSLKREIKQKEDLITSISSIKDTLCHSLYL